VAVVAALLVIAVNLASLLLARVRRGHEAAIRVALGASRLRVMRQVVIENLMLAVGGGASASPSRGSVCGCWLRARRRICPGWRTPVWIRRCLPSPWPPRC
jgi:predicted lysophospholipase L1 biosynthesis ABC-type transport system permease subunit